LTNFFKWTALNLPALHYPSSLALSSALCTQHLLFPLWKSPCSRWDHKTWRRGRLHLDFKKRPDLILTLLVQMMRGGASNLNSKLPETAIQNITLKASFRNGHPTAFS